MTIIDNSVNEYENDDDDIMESGEDGVCDFLNLRLLDDTYAYVV